ncbi:MAG TPA: acyl-CoA dehydrogenase family protein, partial [Bacillota bacterium]
MGKVDARVHGGGFLLGPADDEAIFTPEQLDEETRQIGALAAEFTRDQVLPRLEELERGEHEHSVALLKAAGELGLLAGDIPERYGGLGLSKATTTYIAEKSAVASSFAITLGAHTGIGTLPIVFFGTPEQKERYLPSLATGERIAAYALTEPDAGSDALGARTRASRSDDGSRYLLSGQKQWISNGGFADLFVVYAKVDGERFTAFIVERGFGGLTHSSEWRKMGLKGSSTVTIFLDNVPVPAANVLGEVGRGHVIAFNTLNIGRWKLAAGCLGSCKELIRLAVDFARERKQFGRTIASFPLIQQKLARMAARTYALESMVYRTAGLFDDTLSQLDDSADDAGLQAAAAIAEYAVEASINKVFGSEALDFVVDEAVQIHGGYGYIQEYAVERAYRDARINRIFEGTNEINRLLIPGTLLRRAMKGEVPLMEALGRVQQELASLSPLAGMGGAGDPLQALRGQVEGARKAALMVAGLGVQKYMMQVEEQQEFLAAAGDLAIELFAAESAVIRAQKAAAAGHPEAALHGALARLHA